MASRVVILVRGQELMGLLLLLGALCIMGAMLVKLMQIKSMFTLRLLGKQLFMHGFM
jgi:hypothetical protein